MPSLNPLASWWSRLRGTTSLTPPDWIVQVPTHTALTRAVMDEEQGPHVAYCARRRTPAGDAYIDRLSYYQHFCEDSSFLPRIIRHQEANPHLKLVPYIDHGTTEIQFVTSGWQQPQKNGSVGAASFAGVLRQFLPPGPGRREAVSGLVQDWQEIANASGRDVVDFILRANPSATFGRDKFHLDEVPHVVLTYLTDNRSTMHAKPDTWHHKQLQRTKTGSSYLPTLTREVRENMASTPSRMSAAWRGSHKKRQNLHMIRPPGPRDKIICIGSFD